MTWKIDVLERLKAKGVWLIDACPVGLYVPGNKRVKISDQEFRKRFVDEVLPTVDTEKVLSSWIIGKTVHDKISDLTPALKGYVLQPQSRLGTKVEYQSHLYPLVTDVCGE